MMMERVAEGVMDELDERLDGLPAADALELLELILSELEGRADALRGDLDWSTDDDA